MVDVSATGFTKEKIESLIGETITGVRLVNGEDLIFTTASGDDIYAGDVKGIQISNATAASLAISAITGITSTNNTAQLALQELAGDYTSLNSSKATNSQVRKFLSGRVDHYCDYAQDGSIARTTVAYPNKFPANFFGTPPAVLITPYINAPGVVAAGWSALNISVTGFSINAHCEPVQSGEFVTPRRLPFHWVATAATP